eukprot:Hpha_TRINITY_DN19891_c0_g1::TRINITY_DN19891_c0_g1_i1::g.132080::m.132080
MGNGMQRVGECLRRYSECVVRSSDSEEDVRIKRVVTPIFTFVVIILSYNLYAALTVLGGNPFLVAGVSLAIFALLSFFVCAVLGMHMGIVIDCILVLLAVSNILVDAYNAAGLRPRSWSLVVIILDTALVLGRHSTITAVISMTLLWMFVASAESAFLFGVYARIASATPVCDCSDPPCAAGPSSAYSSMGVSTLVLLV